MKLFTLSKGWWLFEFTSTQGLTCHIKEWRRVSRVDSTAKGTRLNGRRKYINSTFAEALPQLDPRPEHLGVQEHRESAVLWQLTPHLLDDVPLDWVIMRVVEGGVAQEYLSRDRLLFRRRLLRLHPALSRRRPWCHRWWRWPTTGTSAWKKKRKKELAELRVFCKIHEFFLISLVKEKCESIGFQDYWTMRLTCGRRLWWGTSLETGSRRGLRRTVLRLKLTTTKNVTRWLRMSFVD